MGISPRTPDRGYNPHRMNAGELEVHAKESERFGKEAEKVAPYILDRLSFVDGVAHASKVDDTRHGVDFLLKMKEGGMVGVSFTVSGNRESMLADLRQSLSNPLIPRLHDNEGEVYLDAPIPRVELHGGTREQWEKIVGLRMQGKEIPEHIVHEMSSFFAQEMLIYSKFVADNNKKVAPVFQKLASLVEKSLLEKQRKKGDT